MTRRALAVVTAVALLSLSGCTGQSQHTTFIDPGVPLQSLKLVAFDDCQDLLNGLRSAAKAAVGPYGFGGAYALVDGAAAAGPVPKRAESEANAAAPAAAPDDHSTTNTHEAGVDEPDLVKTDGKRIVTVAGGTLRVVDAATRTVTGSVNLDLTGRGPGYVNLLLDGDHVMVLGQAYKAGSMGAQLTLVDISGPPRVLSQYTMDGSVLDARQIGSTARVVVQSQPRLEFPAPVDGRPLERTAANQWVIDHTPVDAWLPRYTVSDANGKETSGRVDCGSVSRPSQYSGSTTLTVLTFDLAQPAFDDGQPVSIVADGQTVYANGPSLYVAGDQRWRYMWGGVRSDIRPQPSTELYKFDISGPGKPRFVAGGKVDGWLLNQYSLSEWSGNLRVATTAGQPWAGTGSSESTVFVLRESGGELRELGHVGGLGRGERIYAVRFLGTVGYVVTFKQTDPLYTIDLSDARAPKVTGALKITGYSAYLHPIADGQLLGVGQDASTGGRIQGLQVSLFDVRNVAQPTRLSQYTMKSERTEAEFDPHAFLYWAPRGLVVLPVTSGMLVLAVHGATIDEAGMIATSPNDYPQRALVIGDTLWTVSMQGLQANDLTTLARTAWLPNT
jgi:uncharacterized secreted protein with C-terminal beta-propeller domain